MEGKQVTYRQNITELEQIVESIKLGQVDVDVLSLKVERAKALIHECRKTLRTTSENVKRIMEEANEDSLQGGAALKSPGLDGCDTEPLALDRECPPESTDEGTLKFNEEGVYRVGGESIEAALNSFNG